jgi:hypothetical protein
MATAKRVARAHNIIGIGLGFLSEHKQQAFVAGNMIEDPGKKIIVT